jgi:hypothetical protein
MKTAAAIALALGLLSAQVPAQQCPGVVVHVDDSGAALPFFQRSVDMFPRSKPSILYTESTRGDDPNVFGEVSPLSIDVLRAWRVSGIGVDYAKGMPLPAAYLVDDGGVKVLAAFWPEHDGTFIPHAVDRKALSVYDAGCFSPTIAGHLLWSELSLRQPLPR